LSLTYIETKHHFIQKSGGLEQNLGGGLEPLSPIASAATVLQYSPQLDLNLANLKATVDGAE